MLSSGTYTVMSVMPRQPWDHYPCDVSNISLSSVDLRSVSRSASLLFSFHLSTTILTTTSLLTFYRDLRRSFSVNLWTQKNVYGWLPYANENFTYYAAFCILPSYSLSRLPSNHLPLSFLSPFSLSLTLFPLPLSISPSLLPFLPPSSFASVC